MSRTGFGLLALALVATPALAQDVPATTANNSAATTEIIGPPQLRDFDLNGTVTRQATTLPAPRTASPQNERPAPASSVRSERQATRAEPAVSGPRVQSAPAIPVQAPPASDLPAPNSPQPGLDPTVGDAAPVASLPDVQLPGEPGSGFTLWPWLLAGLVAAGAALFLFRRHQQQRERYVGATGAGDHPFDLGTAPEPEAAPTPEPLRRAPVAVAPPKPPSTGIVSTRLRPDLTIALMPERAVVDENGATIEFQVAVRNDGSVPARDVHIEACMVNAGPAQDQELNAFFAHPAANGQAIDRIMPMAEVTLRSAVRLPPDLMRQYEVEGRKLFVPMVGVNAVYQGPAGRAQTSTSYLVGRDGNGEKMAPFRLDLGPRIFRGLGARQHTLGLRT